MSTVTEKDMVIQVLPSRWNASRSFASYLDARPELYRDRNVLELGAGGGLPGLLCALNGAQKVYIITSFPIPLNSNVPHRSC
jgi:predicted nicotinamide N-methyase